MAYNYQPISNQNYFGQSMYSNGNAVPDTLNQFKNQYQPQMQPPTLQVPAPINDMIWVLGEVEATSYPVAPNNTVVLWDKNQHTIYIKSANAQGVPSMRILDYSERLSEAQNATETHSCKCSENYVHIDDFNALKAEFEAMSEKVNSMAKPATKTTRTTRKEKEGE